MIAFEEIFHLNIQMRISILNWSHITSVTALGAFTRRILSVPPKDKEKNAVEFGLVLLNNNNDLFLDFRDTSSPVNIM